MKNIEISSKQKFGKIVDSEKTLLTEEYKSNGFKVKHLGACHCELYDRPDGSSPVPLTRKR